MHETCISVSASIIQAKGPQPVRRFPARDGLTIWGIQMFGGWGSRAVGGVKLGVVGRAWKVCR